MTSGFQILFEYNGNGLWLMSTLMLLVWYATVIPGDDTYYTAADQILSNRTMVDENGNSDQTAECTPYGETRPQSGTLSGVSFDFFTEQTVAVL
jgi:hypothetical protein